MSRRPESFLSRLFPYQIAKQIIASRKLINCDAATTSGARGAIGSSVLPDNSSHPPKPNTSSAECSRQLRLTLQALENALPRKTDVLNSEAYGSLVASALGFRLLVAPSTIASAGLGVFLTAGEPLPASRLVAIYPGTVYAPHDPILLASIRNRYIFRRSDGCFIDAKPTGLSRSVFRSVWYRDRVRLARRSISGAVVGDDDRRHDDDILLEMGDASWLDFARFCRSKPLDDARLRGPGLWNPLAVGQFINDAISPAGDPLHANVMYVEHRLDPNTPTEHRRWLPNMRYAGLHPSDFALAQTVPDSDLKGDRGGGGLGLPMVLLMSCRTICPGDELLASYMQL